VHYIYLINNQSIRCNDLEFVLEESIAFRATYNDKISVECDHIVQLRNKLLLLNRAITTLEKAFLCPQSITHEVDSQEGCINCDSPEIKEISTHLNQTKTIISSLSDSVKNKEFDTADFLSLSDELSNSIEILVC
jgi:hypothetical protein